MMISKPRCSIVIRCYNEGRHLERLFRGIFSQTVKDIELVLVDSGSNDDTLSIASKYPVRIVYISPEEFSFGRSLNLGCKVSNSDFIIIVSAHCYPIYNDWLEKMLAPFDDQKIALVYGCQRGNKTTKFSEHQIFAKWFPDQSNLCQKHPFCNNANAAIRRELWKQLPYNESITGLEDIDWGKKILDMGYHIAYVADANIIHIHNENYNRIYNRYRREAIAFKNIFPHETFSFMEFIRLFIANSYNDCLDAYHKKVLLRNIIGIFTFRWLQFLGSYIGFNQRGPITHSLKNTFYYPNRRIYPNIVKNTSDNRSSSFIDYSKEGGYEN